MKIINVFTGERVKCSIKKANRADIIGDKPNFEFNWKEEFNRYKVFKLTTEENPKIIQAFLSFQDDDGFVYVSKIERANFRKFKVYEGILEVSFAFCCKNSFDLGHNGFISFFAKSELTHFYRNRFNAQQIGSSQRMFINTIEAKKLVDLYYEET